MAKKKKILFPVFFMVGITVIYTLSLALINEASASRIEQQNELVTQNAILYVLGLENTDFQEDIKIINDDSRFSPYYIYTSMGKTEAYVFRFSGKGLWGSINGYFAFNTDFSELLGVEFTSHSETPGLGGRIDETWFKEQFRGLKLQGQSTVQMNTATGGNVDGITGATLTGNAVKNILNTSIADVKKNAEEGNFNE